MDNLSYAYDSGNKLMSVTDAVNTPALMKGEFKDGNKVGNDYSYDLNGNLKTDANKGITDITYNHKNLPVEININGVANGDIKYIYDATGLKLKKIVTEGGVQKETSYAGKYTYKNNKLEFFHTSEGYVEPKNPDDLAQGFDYVYQYVDHVGNIRLSYKNVGTSSNVDLEIQEENNYYPFGLKHKGYNTIQSAARDHTYEYNGIEYEESLGLNLMEMELRQFDPAIGRFTSLDPVIHHSMSTYTAFDNNPVFYSDPSGGDSQTIYDFGGNAWTVDCENGECGNARKQNSGTKPKYQIYNISPVGDISIKDGTDNFEILTAYGSPYPEDLDELATDRRKDLLTALQSLPKSQQISLLKKLGVSQKIIKMLTKNASKAGGLFSNTSLLGLAGIPNSLREEGLAGVPILGVILSPLNDDHDGQNALIANDLKWDDVKAGANDMLGTSDLTNVVLIYTNESLWDEPEIKSSDIEVLDSRYPSRNYKHVYYGTQSGNKIHIFGSHNNPIQPGDNVD